jgi:hypothetical protein
MNANRSFRLHHSPSSFALTLALLVLLRRANDQHFAMPTNNFAVVTTLLDGCAHFHDRNPSLLTYSGKEYDPG